MPPESSSIIYFSASRPNSLTISLGSRTVVAPALRPSRQNKDGFLELGTKANAGTATRRTRTRMILRCGEMVDDEKDWITVFFRCLECDAQQIEL